MSIEPRKERVKFSNLVVQQAQRECDSEPGAKNCCHYHRADSDEELGFFTFYCNDISLLVEQNFLKVNDLSSL